MNDLPWIQTRSGIAFTPTAPRVEDLDINDIAWSLAHQPRFKGHTRKPYSVAEHCWRMSFMVPPEADLWALMHDAGEAYIGDIPAPLKFLAPGLVECEERIMGAVVAKWFDCHVPHDVQEVVHTCDKWIVHEEAKLLMAPRPRAWFPQPDFTPVSTPSWDCVGLVGETAYRWFLSRFETLSELRAEAAA